MRNILIIVTVFIGSVIFAQTNMNIRKTDGSLVQIDITDIDSIYYETVINFNCGDNITDIDGNTYGTVSIGNQCWMKNDLKVSHYADGTEIPNITDDTDWGNLGDNNTDKAFAFYNNDANNESDTYGALYTWAAAMNGENSSTTIPSNVQGACPTGWHLPSDGEWVELTDFMGGTSVAGQKMKEVGSAHWTGTNSGTDEFGFTALPIGTRRDNSGAFESIGGTVYWWCTTEEDAENTYTRQLYYMGDAVAIGGHLKSAGQAIRCIKD